MKTLQSTSIQIIFVLIIACMGLFTGSLSAQSFTSANNAGMDKDSYENGLYTLFIPNCFTPNNDGLNDKFMVGSDLVKRLSLRIYDKMGEEVFATIQMDQGWDGKFHGRELKQDAYLYRVEVDYMNGTNEVIVGQVNLMR